MANIINLTFTNTRKDLGFCLCATVKGSTKRHYKKVEGLVNPNFDSWDKKKQLFDEPTKDAIHNNKVLHKMKEYYQKQIGILNPSTGKELFEPRELSSTSKSKTKKKAKNRLTLGEYLEKIIFEMKNETIKVPSKNYQLYVNLLHKLERQKKIINIPLADINDNHFMKFGEFVLKELKGVNYVGLMILFHATIEKARESKYTNVILGYKFRKFAPKRKSDIERAINGVSILTKKEYQKFVTMDLSVIPQSGINREYFKELYRDFCIFLYEMKIRPCDLIRLHTSDIKGNIISMPIKKKMNCEDPKLAIQTVKLTDTAKAIIRKYKGQSTKGYIFPFAMNNYDWDIYNAESFNRWCNRKQATLQKINSFLSKVKKVLKVDVLTLYTFRHSAFTHEIRDNQKSLLQIAKEGGTGVKMLEMHYYNHIRE